MRLLRMQQNESKKETSGEYVLEKDKQEKTNKEILECLKNDAKIGQFFHREVKIFVMKTHHKRPLGKGSEGKVFKATGTVEGHAMQQPLAVKIYPTGVSLRDVRTLWPKRLLKLAVQQDLLSLLNTNLCLPLGATVLEDDRFAFVFPRHGGDLRKLINDRMPQNGRSKDKGPFSPSYTLSILHKIAKGMETLHRLGFLHRDLKAANVLYPVGEEKRCNDRDHISGLYIADFGSASKGTGFWRAPEILRHVRERRSSQLPFTVQEWRRADVYSYAMTCYEVLTGRIPLEEHALGSYDAVICGLRPTLPEDNMVPEIGDLVGRCWQDDPLQRPSFREIVRVLESICHEYDYVHDHNQCEVKKKHKRRVSRVNSPRVDSMKEVLKNRAQMDSAHDFAAPSSSLNIVVQQKKKNSRFRRATSMSSGAGEKTTDVRSLKFRALNRSRSLHDETLPTLRPAERTEKKIRWWCSRNVDNANLPSVRREKFRWC
jgi:serine/threonine protein kinase